MDRRGSLWTLPGRAWLAIFAIVVIILGVWIGVAAAQPSVASASAGGTANSLGSGGGSGESAASPPSVSGPSASTKPAGLTIVEPPLLHKTAVAVLALLPAHEADSGADYQRTQDFGEAWIDVDGNGCDTRDDILARDLKNTVKDGCEVESGSFIDPYTAQKLAFTRGNDTSILVQIDHLVPLGDAWISGAQELTQAQRENLANDPTNLLAVDGRSNEQKSDDDASEWLPSYAGIHCEYAARQISVKYAYGLWVSQSEHDALAGVLKTCPEQPAYRSSLGSSVTARAPGPKATSTPTQASSGSVVYYKNCSAAYAAGAHDLRKGRPGYRSGLDRDGDGIACEG